MFLGVAVMRYFYHFDTLVRSVILYALFVLQVMNLTMKEQFHLGIVNGQLDVVEDILDTSPSLVHYVDEVRLFVICVTFLFCMSHGQKLAPCARS